MKLHGRPNLARGPEFDTHALHPEKATKNSPVNCMYTGFILQYELGVYESRHPRFLYAQSKPWN